MNKSVYVVVASEHGEQKECIVLSNVSSALRVHETLCGIYGGVNVTLSSRAIDDIPANIQRVLTHAAPDLAYECKNCANPHAIAVCETCGEPLTAKPVS